jgi:hypothetical protein
MKTAILTAAMMILMTAANARTLDDTINSIPSAEQIFKVCIVQPGANIINFRVANPAAEKVVLKIYNDEMVKIFHRTIKSNKELSIKCDMSNCGSGTYTCVVERNKKEELRKRITLN